MSRAERKAVVRPDVPGQSLSPQCEILSISRSSFYYAPKGESPENLVLMRRIDGLFLKYPFYGSRQMTRQLHREGIFVGRHRVSSAASTVATTSLGADGTAPLGCFAMIALLGNDIGARFGKINENLAPFQRTPKKWTRSGASTLAATKTSCRASAAPTRYSPVALGPFPVPAATLRDLGCSTLRARRHSESYKAKMRIWAGYWGAGSGRGLSMKALFLTKVFGPVVIAGHKDVR